MDKREFDLEDHEELLIHDRILKYFESNKSYDEARKLVAADFPYLQDRLKDCVDHMLFQHYHISETGKLNTELVGIELFTSNNSHEPFATHGSLATILMSHSRLMEAASS